MRTTLRQLAAAARALLVLTLLLGLAYPAAVWALGQLPGLRGNAEGSLVATDGRRVGSDLIGQAYLDANGVPLAQYFQSRASAAGEGYDPTATAASNRGPEDVVDTPDDPATEDDEYSASLLTSVCARSEAVAAAERTDGARPYCRDGVGDPRSPVAPAGTDRPIPPDAVTASASGLDPHISPAYARLQVLRIARARSLPAEQVRDLVETHVQGRVLGFLGEPRVNVLQLNLALDELGT